MLTLEPEFFAEVNDVSKVTLTLHFWSGTTVSHRDRRCGGRSARRVLVRARTAFTAVLGVPMHCCPIACYREEER
ncbi:MULTISPECIES: hypothetical protein [unclassified Streptosporangium]|uniref:hypothetical protein n=1 Tax=unclassified Streptosporangium TaxID=2632669 RepID=UPI003FA385EF